MCAFEAPFSIGQERDLHLWHSRHERIGCADEPGLRLLADGRIRPPVISKTRVARGKLLDN